MKLFFYIFTLFLIFSGASLYSQNRTINWAFGDSAALNFSQGFPVPDTNFVLSSSESCTSISDTSGNLLFYVGSPDVIFGNTWIHRIWNRNHLILMNGDSIKGNASITQGTLILPFPDNNSLFYVFSISRTLTGNNYLYYSIVDMTLDNGVGAVSIKNQQLNTNGFTVTEKLNAVKHGNGRDWWLVTHQEQSTNFLSFLISPSGIFGPFTQSIGTYLIYKRTWGQLKFSNDGARMCVVGKTAVCDLFNYDRCTGVISNWTYLGDTLYETVDEAGYYGCSFSPNNNLLYISSWDSLFQFDLTASNILASKTLIYVSPCVDTCAIGQHQLANDNKIYIANMSGISVQSPYFNNYNTNISFIENPNIIGTGCNFSYLGTPLGGKRSFFGLPNFPNYELSELPGSFCDTLTGLLHNSDLLNLQIKAEPNPTEGNITIKFPIQQDTGQLKLYNAIGELISTSSIVPNIKSMDLNIVNLPLGIYFINAYWENGFGICKIIKN
ncbi:MAG: T9SS type A sorting domain-containing protein [Arcticibacter sp.]